MRNIFFPHYLSGEPILSDKCKSDVAKYVHFGVAKA